MAEPALLPANQMARRLRVTLRWLRAEAEAGRIPCLHAEKQLLFDSDTVEQVLLERARDAENYKSAGAKPEVDRLGVEVVR